jgi:hypothetical protein
MKMTFLLFCVIILNDTCTRFFSTSFVVHCCLVWCVGVPQSFFTVHNECGTKILAPLKSKKNFQTSAEIPFNKLRFFLRFFKRFLMLLMYIHVILRILSVLTLSSTFHCSASKIFIALNNSPPVASKLLFEASSKNPIDNIVARS